VLVVEKGSDVATGASHANGAQLSYSYVDPFPGPGVLRKLPGYLLGTDPAIQLGLSFKLDYLRWGLSFLQNCTHTKFKNNQKIRLALANLSREAMSTYERDLPKGALSRTGTGKLVLAQTEAENVAMITREDSDEALERNQSYLSPSECLDVEPGLMGWKGKLYGGTYSASDNALDPVTYCKALQLACEYSFKVRFLFNQNVQKIDRVSNAKFEIETDVEIHECEKVVVCLGNDPNSLLKPLGIQVPIYPMQGYSLTIPASDQSPRTSVTDLKNKIVFANLGNKIRIAGFLDANLSLEKSKARGGQLLNLARQQWPTAADYEGPVSHWTHYRPMTPSGVPVIGETLISGLYLNSGHGSLGYTFAAGSGMKIASEIGHAQKNSTEQESDHATL
jgi:D-amino-acid dehydrogenase